MVLSAHHRLPRLLVAGPLGPGAETALEPDQAHYVLRVLRLAAGGPIRVFDGQDGEWLARLARAGRSEAILRVESRLRVQGPAVGPDLIFALVKKPALDLIVEKAVELGVGRLRPVRTRFAQRDQLNLVRAAAHVRGAVQQCERLDVPEVVPPMDLDELTSSWPADRPLVLAAESGASEAAVPVLARLGGGPPPGLLVGPEGGFHESELDALGDLPFVHAVHLGPRILRAETACLALLAVWQAVGGDWQDRPRSSG